MSRDLFRRVRKPCSSPYACQRAVSTLAYVQHPVCRPCRRRLANLRKGRALTMRAVARRARAYAQRSSHA